MSPFADDAPNDDATESNTTQADAPSPADHEGQAGAHPIPEDEPATSIGQAAVPAPDTSAQSYSTETE